MDDAYVVSSDKEWLRVIIPKIRNFLISELELELHMGKVQIHNAKHGADFLGAFVKPYRTYIENKALNRTIQGVYQLDTNKVVHTYLSLNSYLGVMGHFSSYNIRRNLFLQERFLKLAPYNNNITKFCKPVLI